MMRGLLVALAGSCEAYSLIAVPRAAMRAHSPVMNYEQLSKPADVHVDFEDFRYGVGNGYEHRQYGGDASTAITTGVASAATANDGRYWVEYSPSDESDGRTGAPSGTFVPSFGDNTPERKRMLHGPYA